MADVQPPGGVCQCGGAYFHNDAHDSINTHPDAALIPLVEEITPEVMALADGAGSALGTGGMATKLRAARMVTGSGADMVIANGAHPEVLYDIADGKPAGTRFKGRRQEDPA